jgi:hypothetical protein
VTALVVVEAVAIALLSLLVAGLLRSHAEILRSLHGLGVNMEGDDDAGPTATPAPRGLSIRSPGEWAATDLVGTTPADEAVAVSVVGAAHRTLVAFLSGGCATCAGFWDALSEEPARSIGDGTRLVIVTKGPEAESPSAIGELAPPRVPTVMSTTAWDAYRVPMVPYFVYVDGPSGEVVGEGAAGTWQQLLSLVERANADAGLAQDGFRPRRSADQGPVGHSAAAREAREERALMAAGVHPGHPSLHPSEDDERPADEEGLKP